MNKRTCIHQHTKSTTDMLASVDSASPGNDEHDERDSVNRVFGPAGWTAPVILCMCEWIHVGRNVCNQSCGQLLWSRTHEPECTRVSRA